MSKQCLLLLPLSLYGAVTNVQLQGVTPTQATLSYTAPDESACRIEVSESASYAPLVHDVDPSLFAGSNSDARSGSITDGRYRLVVIGRHGMMASGTSNPFLAADGHRYSRALQANTTHYYRLTCGSDVASGSFSTANIPLGGTYPEPLAADAAGNYNWPSVVNPSSRAEPFVDPNTGVLIRKVTMPGDSTPDMGANSWPSGGMFQLCSHALASANGHTYDLCVIWSVPSLLVSVETDTGNVYALTRLVSGHAGCPAALSLSGTMIQFSPTDPLKMYLDLPCNQAGSWILKATWTGALTGDGTNVGTWPGISSHLTTVDLTPNGLQPLLTVFDPTYDYTNFGVGQFYGTQMGKLMLYAETQQDSFGYINVFDPGNDLPIGAGGTGGFIASSATWKMPVSRWCTIHTPMPMGDHNPWVSMQSNSSRFGAEYGGGAYFVIVDNNPGTGTSIRIRATNGSYEPQSTGNPAYLQDAQPGDYFMVGNLATGYEPLELVSKDAVTHTWTMIRGNNLGASKFISGSDITPVSVTPSSLTAGAYLYAACRASSLSAALSPWGEANEGGVWYWNFINDPHGTSITYPAVNGSTSNQVVENYMTPAHMATRDSINIGDQGNKAGIPGLQWSRWDYLNSTPGYDLVSFSGTIAENPTFAGVAGPDLDGGNNYEQHPSWDQAAAPAWEQQWMVDAVPMNNTGSSYGATGSLIGGLASTYKMTGGAALHRKQVTTLASCGAHPLEDISSAATGNVISDATPYAYCVANAANECRAGALPGNMFVNCPGATKLTCDTNANTGAVDICLGDSWAYGNAAVQASPFTTDLNGASGRVISYMFGTHHEQGVFSNVRPTSDGKWLLFPGFLPTGTTEAYMAKLPPFPAADSTRRDSFKEIRVKLAGVAGADNAIVEFGYAENADPGNFYCTARQETCVAQGGTISASQPFYFSTIEAASITGTPCSSGCTIAIPALAGRVVYYRVSLRDKSGNIVQRQPMTAQTVR
ncbi:MAG: hypothetical protein ABSG26_05145 [Bryobacteraceae bacterium]|jgi:hypothetical protein